MLDGLDRVQSLDRARALFIESDLLSRLQAALIVCAPFIPHQYLEAANVRAFERTRLLCEPVVAFALDANGRPTHGPAIPFFHEVYRKRAADLGLESAITEKDLDTLAFYSGGRIREFVRLVRNVAGDADVEGVQTAGHEIVERVVQRERLNVEEALNVEHIRILRSVMTDPMHELPADPAALELLTTARLLPYPDGSEWFFPHPLLTIRKLT